MNVKQVKNPWIAGGAILVVGFFAGLLDARAHGEDELLGAARHAVFPMVMAFAAWIVLRSPFAKIVKEVALQDETIAGQTEVERTPEGGTIERQTVVSKSSRTTETTGPEGEK